MNDRINLLLSEIYSSSESYKLKQESSFNSETEWREYRKLLLMVMYDDLKLVTKPHEDGSIFLSERGRDISINGGWNKYLQTKKEIKDKERKKLEYDLKISKFKSKTVFPALILGSIGGIYSIIKIIILLIGLSTPKQEQETKEQKELEKPNKISQTEYHKPSESLHNQGSLKIDSLLNYDQSKPK